ncbi:MAG: hypothetical protein KF764_31510 [Labilithrix sp.]|nr:hypothetical protein [Labilithrix sp.]
MTIQGLQDLQLGECTVPLCEGGTVVYFEADGQPSFRECSCSVRKRLVNSIDLEARTAMPLEGHTAFIRDNGLSPGLRSSRNVVLRGARADFLAVMHRYTVEAFLRPSVENSVFELVSDQQILDRVRRYQLDPDENQSPEELAVGPKHLFVWLGTLTKGWENTCSLITDVLRLRNARSLMTWLAFDPAAPLWLMESESWPSFESFLADYSMLEIPKIAEAKVAGAGFFTAAAKPSKAPAGVTPSAGPKEWPVASGHGKCVKCGGKIAKGDAFAWANSVGLAEENGKKACRACAEGAKR